MNQPLGDAIGNSIEIEEGINILKNKGSKRLFEVIETLGSEMLKVGKRVDTTEEGKNLLEKPFSMECTEQIKEIIEAQGGNSKVIEDFSLLPQAKFEKVDVQFQTKVVISKQ